MRVNIYLYVCPFFCVQFQVRKKICIQQTTLSSLFLAFVFYTFCLLVCALLSGAVHYGFGVW